MTTFQCLYGCSPINGSQQQPKLGEHGPKSGLKNGWKQDGVQDRNQFSTSLFLEVLGLAQALHVSSKRCMLMYEIWKILFSFTQVANNWGRVPDSWAHDALTSQTYGETRVCGLLQSIELIFPAWQGFERSTVQT